MPNKIGSEAADVPHPWLWAPSYKGCAHSEGDGRLTGGTKKDVLLGPNSVSQAGLHIKPLLSLPHPTTRVTSSCSSASVLASGTQAHCLALQYEFASVFGFAWQEEEAS